MKSGVERPARLVDGARTPPRPRRVHKERRAADRRDGDQQRPRRPSRRTAPLPGVDPGRAGRGLRSAAQHGHGRRKPAPAHPLRLLHRSGEAGTSRSPAAVARPSRASTTITPSSVPPRTAWPRTPRTWPWPSPPSTPSSRTKRRTGRDGCLRSLICRAHLYVDRRCPGSYHIPSASPRLYAPVAARSRYRKVRERASMRSRSASSPPPSPTSTTRFGEGELGSAAASAWPGAAGADLGTGERRGLRRRRVAELAAARTPPHNRIQGAPRCAIRGDADRVHPQEGGPDDRHHPLRRPRRRRRPRRWGRRCRAHPRRGRGQGHRGGALRGRGPEHPELAHGWLCRPDPVARGRIRVVESAPVLAMPGVVAVLHHENAPRLNGDYTNAFGA